MKVDREGKILWKTYPLHTARLSCLAFPRPVQYSGRVEMKARCRFFFLVLWTAGMMQGNRWEGNNTKNIFLVPFAINRFFFLHYDQFAAAYLSKSPAYCD